MQMDDVALRQTFNTQAELYNAVRPHYPPELFEALVEVTQLADGANLLEIGPGTGQATVPFAERGYYITAVELGDAMATVAQRELEKYPNVEIITGAFEDIDLSAESFDLVYSATALHWVKPEMRFTKPHRLLKSDGHLAIIHTNHLSDDFYHSTEPIYKKYEYDRPKSSNDAKVPLLRDLADVRPSAFDESLFGQVFFKVFPVTLSYDADTYCKLISTYSPTLAMTPVRREEFLNEMKDLINTKFEGQITRRYGMSLTVGKKK